MGRIIARNSERQHYSIVPPRKIWLHGERTITCFLIDTVNIQEHRNLGYDLFSLEENKVDTVL